MDRGRLGPDRVPAVRAVVGVRQLRHCFEPFHAKKPPKKRVFVSTLLVVRLLIGVDWCLQSDVMPGSPSVTVL